MTNDDGAKSDDLDDDEQESPAWQALEVMKERARAARLDRDQSLRSLRESASDEEIREDFGIDLREIEG